MKKLTLNKSIISNLTRKEAGKIKGGGTGITDRCMTAIMKAATLTTPMTIVPTDARSIVVVVNGVLPVPLHMVVPATGARPTTVATPMSVLSFAKATSAEAAHVDLSEVNTSGYLLPFNASINITGITINK